MLVVMTCTMACGGWHRQVGDVVAAAQWFAYNSSFNGNRTTQILQRLGDVVRGTK